MNILAIKFSDYILDIFTLFFLERKRGGGTFMVYLLLILTLVRSIEMFSLF